MNTTNKKFFLVAFVFFGLIFLLSGLIKFNGTFSENNKIQKMQNKLNQQEVRIDELEKKISEQMLTQKNQLDEYMVQVDKQQICNNVRVLYANLPNKPDKAIRVMPAYNIVALYKLEKKDLEESFSAGVMKDFKEAVEPAYKKYLEEKKLCPEFQEF